MTRRVHLREYEEAELAAMEAGPLLDWLVAQAMGFAPQRDDPRDKWVTLRRERLTNGHWWDDEATPTCTQAYSTDGGAMLRALKWLAANAPWTRLASHSNTGASWVVESVTPGGTHRLSEAPTAPLAISRAVAVVGRRKLAEERAG